MTSIALTTPDGGSSVRTVYRTRTRRAPARRRRRAPVRRRRSVSTARIARGARRARPVTKFALANMNPFDQRADGCKVPDSNTYPSGVIKCEDEFTMTTDATYGLAAKVFRPYPTGMVVNTTAASANSWSFTSAFGGTSNSTRASSITSGFTVIRPVAHGIRLYAPTAPTSTTGFVHVCIYAQSEFSSGWSFPQTISQMNNAMFYQRFPLAMLTQKSVTVVNKFLDSSATRYLDPASDVAAQGTDMTFQTEGWAGIVVAVEGAPVNTNALVVESVSHLEGIPFVNSVNIATPAAPFDISALEGVSRSAGQAPGAFVQGEEAPYMQIAYNAYNGMADQVYAYGNQFAYQAGRYGVGAAFRYASRWLGGNRAYGGGISGVTDNRLASGFNGGLLT